MLVRSVTSQYSLAGHIMHLMHYAPVHVKSIKPESRFVFIVYTINAISKTLVVVELYAKNGGHQAVGTCCKRVVIYSIIP